LLDKFIGERTTPEEEDMHSRHAVEMLVQDVEAQIGQATEGRDAKAETEATKWQTKADVEGDLDKITTRDACQKYLDALTAT